MKKLRRQATSGGLPGRGAYLTAILAGKYQFGLDWTLWLMVMFGILIGAANAAFFGLFRSGLAAYTSLC